MALLGVLAASLLLLGGAIAMVAPRFGDYAVAAAGADSAPARQKQRPAAFRATSPRRVLRRKEWLLLRRDPWLASQTLMQMLYLAPPAVLLWRGFAAGGSAYNLLVPVLVMAAGQLAGGLAWLTISGEDAPDLVATAPVTGRLILRAKIEAVLGIIALVFAPLLVALAVASPWHALVTASGIVIAAASATAIQLWFRSQAKRSQFRRRQVSSRVATFAEAFSSIAWAATAAVAAVNLLLAIAPALMALIVLGGARYLSRAQSARGFTSSLPLLAMTRLPHRDQQNDDLAHLFDRAEHVAGLTADLFDAQTRQQRDGDRERNHRRDRVRDAERGDQRDKSQRGGNGGRVACGWPTSADSPSLRAGVTKNITAGMAARAAQCAAIKAAATSPGSSRLAKTLARSRIDSASAQTPYVPVRLSRMMSSFCSRVLPPPKPSAVSARPSSCRQPVAAKVAATASAAADHAGSPSR